MRIRLIDVVFFIVAVATGMYCGFWLDSRFGTLAGLLGFVLGFIAGLAALFACCWLLIFVFELFRPPFPRCQRGKCSSFEGYQLVEEWGSGKEKPGHIRLCKCGGKYLMRGFSGFGYAEAWEILEDGTTRPYRKYAKRFGILGRWEAWLDETS